MMVEFLAEAEEEMMEAAVFYQEQAKGLGERFLEDVERTTQLLDKHPLIGQAIDNHLRRLLAPGHSARAGKGRPRRRSMPRRAPDRGSGSVRGRASPR